MNKILIIDDNPKIQAANHEYLTGLGYAVDMAMNAADAFALLRDKTYDCIVLDIMLPVLDGFALCAAARQTTRTPIIFLSCLDGDDDRVKGLMAGGDDYMTKPYSLKEMAARINAQIRRDKVLSESGSGVESPAPGVMVHRETHTVAIGGRNLLMSGRECEILSLMLKRPGETITKRELLALTGMEGGGDGLAVYIRRLRGRLGTDESLGKIETVFGEGYRYVPVKGTRI